jgi:transposase
MTYDYHWWESVFDQLWSRQNESQDVVIRDIAAQNPRGPQRTCIQGWVDQFENHGVIGPQRQRTQKALARIDPAHFDIAKRILHELPIAYPSELCEVIFQETGYKYCKQAMHDALLSQNITRTVLEYRAREQSAPLRASIRIFLLDSLYFTTKLIHGLRTFGATMVIP